MPQQSAGLLMFRRRGEELEVFLVHPGGPFWKERDLGAWTIPKGQCGPAESPVDAAQREFREETGFVPLPPFLELGSVRQGSGKIVHAWAFEGDCNPEELVSNFCEIEWPPRSKRRMQIPEVDRGEWFGMAEAAERMLPPQRPLLERLARLLHREAAD